MSVLFLHDIRLGQIIRQDRQELIAKAGYNIRNLPYEKLGSCCEISFIQCSK